MHYYLYEITNQVNGKIYVGVHKTKSLDDGYMGSGKVIRHAIEKHGIENFTKVILETFDDSAAMYAREKEVVTAEFLAREDVYNLRRGGFGGFDHINSLNKMKDVRSSNMKNMPIEIRSQMGKKQGQKNAVIWKTQPELNPSLFCREFNVEMSKRAATPEANLKRIETAKRNYAIPENNPAWGSMWITNEQANAKVKKDSIIPAGWRRGRVM